MKIIYKKGDLMNASERFIVHGCNAQGVMGSGVAKLIRDKYPQAYEEYAAYHKKHGLYLGATIWVPGSPHVVINAVTQDQYGRDPNVVYANYDAIRSAFEIITAVAWRTQKGHAYDLNYVGEPVREIAMPLIGAGLANGKWSIISDIIQKASGEVFQPVVYLVDGIIPDGVKGKVIDA